MRTEGRVHLVSIGLVRTSARTDRFMPASLLDSQLDTLEALETDEVGFEVTVDRMPRLLVQEIVDRLGVEMALALR